MLRRDETRRDETKANWRPLAVYLLSGRSVVAGGPSGLCFLACSLARSLAGLRSNLMEINFANYSNHCHYVSSSAAAAAASGTSRLYKAALHKDAFEYMVVSGGGGRQARRYMAPASQRMLL